ncbi:MAG: hypothetical protein H6881_08305 [Rhodobiaceae bacterium]|nr:hypothetical protein [Rhodobiaceae bacterium]MCC0051865.1 hypothetical protein [Rhodobiaceae bacterium]
MSRSAVIAAIEDAKRKPFKPGTHDCALFVAAVVKAKTGRDYARGWRSKYRSLKAGQALLQEAGFDDHIAIVAAHFEEIPPALARFGDIAVVEDALGIVNGGTVFVLRPDGLGTVDLLSASRAFRVR